MVSIRSISRVFCVVPGPGDAPWGPGGPIGPLQALSIKSKRSSAPSGGGGGGAGTFTNPKKGPEGREGRIRPPFKKKKGGTTLPETNSKFAPENGGFQ